MSEYERTDLPICRHGVERHWRIKAGASYPTGEPVFTDFRHGQWGCDLCHPPARPLVDYGLVEWKDGRETLPMRPFEIRRNG